MIIENLAQLVAQVESNGTLGALRFERSFRPTIINVQRCRSANKPMSYDTAQIMCACSFGKYQIMGENLYSLGYDGTIAAFLNSDDLQDRYFGKFCKMRDIDYSLTDILTDQKKRDRFATRYNGSTIYGTRMLAVYNHLTGAENA